jgi:thiaminase
MTVFTEHLAESNRDLWMAMAGHPFVLGLADGTLPDGALQAWVQQDRIFVVEERRSWPRSAPTACRRGCALLAPPSSSPDLLRPWVRMVSG